MFLSAAEQVQEKKEYQLHPKGIFRAVCVDVVTHKRDGTPYQSMDGTKNQLALVFQTDRTMEPEEEGGEERHFTKWEYFNIPESIKNEKAKLNEFLTAWEVPIKDYQTMEDFEEAVIGRPANLVITHKPGKEGKTYVNIDSCTAVEDASQAFVAQGYTRFHDQKGPF